MRGRPLLTLSGGELLQHLRDDMEAVGDPELNTDAAWIAGLDRTDGLTEHDVKQLYAMALVALARREILMMQGPGEVAEPMEGTDP
jgi:hypothetical protein